MSLDPARIASADPHAGEYYWCLKDHRVEPYEACKNADRLGPYASPEEAAHAMQIVAARNKQWEEDPRFNDDQDKSDDDADNDDPGPLRSALGG